MKFLYLTAAGLVGVLLAVPAPTEAGTPCGYYQPYYSYQTYTAPSYANTCPNTNAASYVPPTQYVPVETFYQVGQATLNARLIQEATDASLNKFKAELAAQAQAAAAQAEKDQDKAFKTQVVQALAALAARQTAPAVPAPNPEIDAIRAENAQLKAALQQIIDAQKARGALPSAPPGPLSSPPPNPQPPPTPKTEGATVPASPASPATPPAPGATARADYKAAVTALFKNRCASCHDGSQQKALTDPDRVSVERLTDCIERVRDPDPKRRMPKTGEPLTGEEYFALENYTFARIRTRTVTTANGN